MCVERSLQRKFLHLQTVSSLEEIDPAEYAEMFALGLESSQQTLSSLLEKTLCAFRE